MAGRRINAESLEDSSAHDDMVGHFLHKISARHSTDKDFCWIVGSVLLPRGRLAVVDQYNKCVKLFDLEARKLTGKVSFSLEPQDITAIGEDRLAVVFYNQPETKRDMNEQIQYMTKQLQIETKQLQYETKQSEYMTKQLQYKNQYVQHQDEENKQRQYMTKQLQYETRQFQYMTKKHQYETKQLKHETTQFQYMTEQFQYITEQFQYMTEQFQYITKQFQYKNQDVQHQDDENKQRQYENKEVQYLQLVRVKPKLARSITLPLPGRDYRGVTCRGDKLYLLCWDPHSIQIFNLHGTLLNQINGDNNDGERLFGIPDFIAVSPDGADIYVRDFVNNVVCLTTEGQRNWTFSLNSCNVFAGMDVDKRGRLFVCSEDRPINILSSAGRPGRLLLDKKVWDPCTVAVGDGRMYLGRSDEISVFRLEAADSARQLQYVCEDLPPPVEQSMNLSGDISLRDNTRDRESYRLPDNNRYDSPSENQPLELPSHLFFRDTNRDRDSCRLPCSSRPDVRLEDIEEEPPVKLPKFE